MVPPLHVIVDMDGLAVNRIPMGWPQPAVDPHVGDISDHLLNTRIHIAVLMQLQEVLNKMDGK